MSECVTVIAVDGPAAAGKGTLARRLAGHFGYDYLDTGTLYRAVAAAVLAAGGNPADPAVAMAAAKALAAARAAGDDLRSEAVSQAASVVAAIPAVRAALLDFQRNFAAAPPGGTGAVLDGRDIGTVVCPGADAKLFITASIDVRADRRVKELQERGGTVIREAVLRDMRERDARDQARSAAPLEPAADALVVDTSALDADAVFALAAEFVRRKAGGDGSGR